MLTESSTGYEITNNIYIYFLEFNLRIGSLVFIHCCIPSALKSIVDVDYKCMSPIQYDLRHSFLKLLVIFLSIFK